MSDDVETDIRGLIEGGELNAAMEGTLEAYGTALYGYIFSLARDHQVAEEVFQMASVDIWRGLEGFSWRSALKTWCFTVSRNAWLRYSRSPHRRRFDPLTTDAQRNLIARATRSATQQWRRTESKHWLWEVVERFDAEDQQLFRLRLMHKMAWKEIARLIYEEPGAPLDDDQIKRRSARLRKRYNRLKEELRDARAEQRSE